MATAPPEVMLKFLARLSSVTVELLLSAKANAEAPEDEMAECSTCNEASIVLTGRTCVASAVAR